MLLLLNSVITFITITFSFYVIMLTFNINPNTPWTVIIFLFTENADSNDNNEHYAPNDVEDDEEGNLGCERRSVYHGSVFYIA